MGWIIKHRGRNLRLTTAAPGSQLLSSKVMGQKAWRAWEGRVRRPRLQFYPCTDSVGYLKEITFRA